MKNTNQNWKGLTQDLFNPQLFKETLLGEDCGNDEFLSDFSSDHLTIEEMNYRDFVGLMNSEKGKKKKVPGGIQN